MSCKPSAVVMLKFIFVLCLDWKHSWELTLFQQELMQHLLLTHSFGWVCFCLHIFVGFVQELEQEDKVHGCDTLLVDCGI